MNKIDTIVYPFILWSLLQGSIEAFLANYTNGSVTFTEVLALWEPRAQFWFLYSLFFIFLISGFIFSYISYDHIFALFLLSCALYIFKNILPNTAIIYFTASNLVFFLLGVFFTNYKLHRIFNSNLSLVTVSILFVISQYWFHFLLGMTYLDVGIASLVVATIGIFMVTTVSIHLCKTPSNVLGYVGASSLAIYLMHTLAGSGVRILLQKGIGLESATLHLVLGCIAGIMFPLLALRLFRIFRIKYALSAPISNLFVARMKD